VERATYAKFEKLGKGRGGSNKRLGKKVTYQHRLPGGERDVSEKKKKIQKETRKKESLREKKDSQET